MKARVDRREFIAGIAGSAAAISTLPRKVFGSATSGHSDGSPTREATNQDTRKTPARIKFAVIGINHDHIRGQIEAVVRGGGEFTSFYAKEPDLNAAFAKRYPDAKPARSESEILEDHNIQLVVSAGIPNERAPLGIRVMQHGKDYMSDKPGITTLEQLAEVRRVQSRTKQIYSIMYSERLGNRSTVKAGELVKAGAIGRVIQTIGMGPHRMNPKTRPAWFFEHEKYGGVLCDIGSHQADQFLFFTGSTKAEVVASQVGNVHHPQYPGLDDFGDMIMRGDQGTGYVRIDWFTPDGLSTWGDVRLTILGTEGYIELRKNVDIGGRPGDNHLFLVDQKETRYVDCSKQELPYGEQLVSDILNRTETALPQAHTFLATEVALKAQKQAQRLNLKV
jgi:predicted dehydrogenase